MVLKHDLEKQLLQISLSVQLHHFDQAQDAVRVLPAGQEGLDAQDFEVVEELRAFPVRIAVHHLKELSRELKRGGLEIDASRGVGQHEPEVYVHHVALLVQQDVAIVPVLDLQEVADDAIARHALNKVAFRRVVRLGPLAVLCIEIIRE